MRALRSMERGARRTPDAGGAVNGNAVRRCGGSGDPRIARAAEPYDGLVDPPIAEPSGSFDLPALYTIEAVVSPMTGA